MKTSEPNYPFVPKSTAFLRPGQFWAIPLRDGRFACGRVMQLHYVDGVLQRRGFLAGLMDWCGKEPPSFENIAGKSIVEEGNAHIKTITENRGEILGLRPLELDGIEPGLYLDSCGGPNCLVQRGYDVIGRASAKQKRELEVFSTWGYHVIVIAAEMRF